MLERMGKKVAAGAAAVLGMLGLVAAALLFVFATDADAPGGIKDGAGVGDEEPAAGGTQATGPPECDFDPPRFGDVDGDGALDRIVVGTDTRAALGNAVAIVTCLEEGTILRLTLANGQPAALSTADIDLNGDTELIYIDGTRPEGHFVDYVDGRLEPISNLGGRPLILPALPSGGSGQSVATWGCGDLDRDGIGEVVQVTVTVEGSLANYVLTPYELTDGIVETGEAVQGSEPVPDDLDGFARSRVSACG